MNETEISTPRTDEFKSKWPDSRRHNWPCSFESECFYEMEKLEKDLSEVRKDAVKHIALYHQTCMKLETALFGTESESYAQVKKQRNALAEQVEKQTYRTMP